LKPKLAIRELWFQKNGFSFQVVRGELCLVLGYVLSCIVYRRDFLRHEHDIVLPCAFQASDPAARYDYATGEISSDVAEQAEQSFRNVNRALLDSGATMRDIVCVRYILPDRGLFPKTWPVLQKWLGKVKPAAIMMVAGLMEEAMLFEVEVTARIAAVDDAAVVETDKNYVAKTGALPVGI
jgi:enamine deaminase RidA (YjgF/YER057c/UK114 family)